MKKSAAPLTGSTPRQSLDNHPLRHPEVQHTVELKTHLPYHFLKAIGLGNCSRKTIQDETSLAIFSPQALSHQIDHDLVGDQLTLIQILGGLFA